MALTAAAILVVVGLVIAGTFRHRNPAAPRPIEIIRLPLAWRNSRPLARRYRCLLQRDSR